MTRGFNSDIQAVILCGPGHGLDPLIDDDTSFKCFLPIANKPMLYYPITWLQQSGISNIILVAHRSIYSRLVQMIKTYVNESGSCIDILSLENYENGTIEALRAVHPLLDSDFILLTCDLITDFPLYRIIDQHRTTDSLVTALLTSMECIKHEDNRYEECEDCSVYAGLDETKKKLLYLEGKADVDDTINFKMSLITKYPCILLKTNLNDAHCYIFRKSFLEIIDNGSAFGKHAMFSVREELIPRLVKFQSHYAGNGEDIQRNGHKAFTCAVRLVEEGYCLRSNNLKNYTEANKLISKSLPLGPARVSSLAEVNPKSQIGNDSQVGDFTKVGEKTSIKKCTIGCNVTIGKNVKLSNTIVMDNVVIDDNCKIDNCLIAPFVRVKEKCTLKDCDVGPRYEIHSEANIKGEVLSLARDGI